MIKNITNVEELSKQEYTELKALELAQMQKMMDDIANSEDKAVMYKDGRAVTDLKNMLETSAAIYGDKVMYHQVMPGDNKFSEISYKDVLKHVQGLGTSLIQLGLKNSHISIIGPNCYEWAESYHAVTGGTGIVVPLDKELATDEFEHLCMEGEVEAVITCSRHFTEIFKEIKNKNTTPLKIIIGIDVTEADEDTNNGIYSWHKLRSDGMELVQDGDRSFVDARIRNTDLAAIIFTSGTTGVAKGVMLSHYNLCSDVMIAQTYLEVRPEDIFFSILPLHHTYECTCTMIEGMYMGASMAFCRGLKYITRDMQMVRPTFLLAVPLVYDKFYRTVNKALEKQGKNKIVNFLFKLNRITSKIGINVSKPIVDKILSQFGGRIRMFIAGGAKVDKDVLAFFKNLGIKTLQGYGLTETAPMVALNPDQWNMMRNDSAGKVLPYTECKIIDKDEDGNGEICFRGPQIMMGYYKNDEATADCIKDGWLMTGDIGYLDKDNYVYITGRKKNVIIASNGKNVFPEELEIKLLKSPFIGECMVWSDEDNIDPMKRGIRATIRVDSEHIDEELKEKKDDPEEIHKIIDREVSLVNEKLPDWKKIKGIVIKKSEFESTTAMKIKRFVEFNRTAE